MVGTKFLVQWEEHPSHMATRLGYLLENQILVDVTLMCNTHTLKVHKVVLASCSPYFEGVLQKQLGTHPLIVLKDMKFSVLRSLIEFMYCGETSIAEDNLPALLDAAKFFEVKGLASMHRDGTSQPPSISSSSNGSGGASTSTLSKPGPLVSNGGAPNPVTLTNNSSISSTSSNLSSLSGDHAGTGTSTGLTGNLAVTSSKSTPGLPRSRGRITGRGRRSSFINSDPAATLLAASASNDPASILLSLSGVKASTSSAPLITARMSPGGSAAAAGAGRFAAAAHPHTGGTSTLPTGGGGKFLTNGSLGVGERPGPAHTEPRRRGRRKLTESLLESREKSGQAPSPSSSSLAHSIEKSPLLASLLATEQAKKKGATALVTDPRYAEMLKKATVVGGTSTNSPPATNSGSSSGETQTIFYAQNGSGDLVSLEGPDSATFLTVLGGSGELLEGEGGEVTEAVVMQDGTICTAEGNQIAVDSKFVQSAASSSSSSSHSHPLSSSSTSTSSPPSPHHPIKSVLQQVTPPPSDPDAVVLYEMNEESNSLDKYVISSEEVQALRLLNKLMKQKSLSRREISNMIMSNDDSSNTTIAEIDLMLGGGKGKCKSLIKKIMEMRNGLKGTLEKMVASQNPGVGNNNNNSICSGGDESNTNSNCSNSIQDSGGEARGAGVDGNDPQFLLTGATGSRSHPSDSNGPHQISTDEFLISNDANGTLIDNANGPEIRLIAHPNGSVVIDNSSGGNVLIDESNGNVLIDESNENVLIDESNGNVLIDESNGNVLIDESNGNVLIDNSSSVMLEGTNGDEANNKVQNEEMNVEMAFKAMMGDEEDNYETEDKEDDEFKIHNEEDSHSSSHSFTSSQNKIILSNVLMNSGEEMNILAHMDPVATKDLELLDDDCSQEEYLKSNPYSVEEFIGANNKRKSTEDDTIGLKKVKYDDFNHDASVNAQLNSVNEAHQGT